MSKQSKSVRFAEVDRETSETDVRLTLDLDGGTKVDADTGIPFFDHMLRELGLHGHLDLGIKVRGDLSVDDHHTVEDAGIGLGMAIRRAMMDSDAIMRFGSAQLPMDDALVLVSIDMIGRGHLEFDVEFTRESIGGLSLESVREFFQALVVNAGMTVHIRKLAGVNDHHVCEAIFKGFGVAMHQALVRSDRRSGAASHRKVRT